jgi:hypothetical protein
MVSNKKKQNQAKLLHTAKTTKVEFIFLSSETVAFPPSKHVAF